MQLIRIEGKNIPWTVARMTDGTWIARCAPLKLSMEGDSFEELESLTRETMDVLFRSLIAANDLDGFLRGCGWHLVTPIPGGVSEDQLTFAAPMVLETPLYAAG